MSLLSLITTVDNVPLDFATDHDPYYKLFISPDTRPHGFIHPNTLTNLPLPSEFTINHELKTVTLTVATASAANAAFQTAVDTALSLPAHFPQLNSLHSEPFLIPGAPFDSYVHIERFTSSIFGIATRGAHMTAYVRDNDNSLKIWVARRSRNLRTYPGMLDSTVAGGVKATDSPWDCIIAESDEEACLPKSLTEDRVKPTGVVTVANKNRRNELFHGEILYVYDLELQPDEKPVPGDDDEVEEFLLMEWKDVVKKMLASEFKPNVCPVMIDFLIRHGLITPDEKDYVEICTRLRRALPMATSK